MAKYVVERHLPGVTPEALAGAGLRAKTCCAEMTAEGQQVSWLRSFYLPEAQQTHCYFEGPSREAIEEVNQRAQIPFTRIVEVHEMTPEGV
jgi:Nickel responsive protein SCO4226-like